jgi:ABC-type cobalamin/Fe3+-siderophores transport system ATPase subunit
MFVRAVLGFPSACTVARSMELEIEIKNYRCFPDSKPVRIRLGDGFVALIGVNNSGKSSLLRFFYEFRSIFNNSAQNQLTNLANPTAGRGNWGTPFLSVHDPAEIFHKKNNRDINLSIRVLRDSNRAEPPAGSIAQITLTFDRRSGLITSACVPGNITQQQRQSIKIGSSPAQGPFLQMSGRPAASISCLAEAFGALADTLYLGPFRNAINVDAGQDYFDIKVGQAFIAEWRKRKTGPVIEQNDAINGLTEDIRRIFDFDSLEINASDDNRSFKVVVNNRSFRLDELGAGLAQFIFALANAAIRRPSFILIDEPEQNLHPSLQIDFLTTLASYAKVGVVFGTHSIGLARAVADRIYSLRRITEGETEVRDFEATPRLSEFLGELSFSGYQELGFAKVLLVEGPTDVTTFQQLLRIYKKDHQVVILQMGGKSLINASAELELLEVKRICERIVAIIDSEKNGAGATVEKSRDAFCSICAKVGIECHILERRATENYFSDKAVKAAKGENFSGLSPYEQLGSHSPGWSKRENWKIAREMTEEELSDTDLGRALKAF